MNKLSIWHRATVWLLAALTGYSVMAARSAAIAQPACWSNAKPVYVGGVVGFDSLADPTASAALRATGRVGLYEHFNAIPPALFSGHLAAIYAVFAATGPSVAEFGYGFMNNPGFVGSQFRSFFSGMGETPWAVLVNAPDNFLITPQGNASQQSVAAWQAQAATARGLGIKLFLPITAPNDNDGVSEDPASNPHFALMRNVAQAMGGVGIDAPPHYFLVGNTMGPAYRDWLVRWVQWATGQGLRVFWLVSPDVSGETFLADTQKLIAYLQAHNALPHHWVVENYDNFTQVLSVAIAQGGHGYRQARITISPPAVPWGTQSIANATIVDGQVHSIGIVDPGSGYLTANVTITGDGEGAAAQAVIGPRQGSRPAGTVVPGNPALPNPNVVGRDTLPESTAGVALWVASHAPVSQLAVSSCLP